MFCLYFSNALVYSIPSRHSPGPRLCSQAGQSDSDSRTGLHNRANSHDLEMWVSPCACHQDDPGLHDCNWSGLSNLLWSGWSNFGSKGIFFLYSTPTLLLSFTDYTMERKKMFLKGFLLSFLRKFREFNNCWPLANPQAKVFFQLRLHLDPSWQIF